MRDVPVEAVAEYAAEDADITWQLHEKLAPQLKEKEQEKLFKEVEMPLVRVLADMEREGIRLDVDALNAFSKELGEDILVLQEKIIAACGVQFNIDSPKQLGDVLFETLKLGGEKPKKTRTGQYQTSEDVLSAMAHEHAVIPLILDYRSLRKLKGTYVDTLPLAVDPADGRVHTNYRQAVAATGRLSSDEPNLQNIPIRTEKGREIRKAFVPRDENYGLLSADYSQIELRIIAHMSGDANMQEAFRQGLDIHAATAAKVFNTPIEAVTREQRGRAKAVNFGIAYGQGAFGLSQNLGIPRGEAQGIIDGYFAEFPGVKGYMDEMIGFCREHGYVQTMMGRRRYLPDIQSGNNTVRAAAERVAINAPMQGSAADIIKVAMIRRQAGPQGIPVCSPQPHAGRVVGMRLQPILDAGLRRLVQLGVQPGRQLFVVRRLEFVVRHQTTRRRLGAASGRAAPPSSAARIATLARASRDITVPAGTPSTSAHSA